MNVVLLGQGPLPSLEEPFCSFAQLRTWSISKYLESKSDCTIQTHLLYDSPQDKGINIFDKDIAKIIRTIGEWADVVVTAGPHLPMMVVHHLPVEVPLWLDFPSDPLADLDIKCQQETVPETERAIVHEYRDCALNRADAIGVISHRQRWVCLGGLLERGRSVPVFHCPIAFDFPSQKQKASQGDAVLLAGSANAWLNIEGMIPLLKNDEVHCTGWFIPKYLQQTPPKHWNIHGWLDQKDLTSVLEECGFGIWLDRDCLESHLGSRTRALFYIWNGLTPIGSTTTELASLLHKNNSLLEWSDERNRIDIKKAQSFCVRQFSPEVVYKDLECWIDNPIKILGSKPSPLVSENQQLRHKIRAIHESTTWKVGSKIQKFFTGS